MAPAFIAINHPAPGMSIRLSVGGEETAVYSLDGIEPGEYILSFCSDSESSKLYTLSVIGTDAIECLCDKVSVFFQ